MRRPICAFFSFALLLVAATLAAHAEKRVALVIGNSSYEHISSLANPAKDAALVAATLGELGFTLIGGGSQLDLDKAKLDQAVQNFGREIQNAEVALFYYAGHGVQVRGNNYLVPVGANPAREADVDFQLLDANLVLRQMEGSGSRLNLLVLDACRNNPFGGRGLRTAANGLAQMQAPEGTLISFATQPGNVALDGEGPNSPFTQALAATIRKPGLDIFRTFNEVGLAVVRATGGQQKPWVSLSPITGEFYFAGRVVAAEPEQDSSVGPAPSPDPVAEAWKAVQASESEIVLRSFIDRFSDSIYADLAKARLKELQEKKTALVVPPTREPPADPAAVRAKWQGWELTLQTGKSLSRVAVAFSPDGQRVASGDEDGTVSIWDANTGKLLRSLTGPDEFEDMKSVAFSPDGLRIAAGSSAYDTATEKFTAVARMWDTKTGELLHTLEGYPVAFSPDGQLIASGHEKAIKIWDANSGKLLRSLKGHSNDVKSVAFSPDGQRIVSGSLEIIVWDSLSGKRLRTLKAPRNWWAQVAFSPDGQRIAAAEFYEIKIWDTPTGKVLRTLQVRERERETINLVPLSFSPDGQRIASGSGVIKIWDAKTGELLRTLEGHSGHWVGSIAYSPNGQRIVSSGWDATVRIWDANTGRLLTTLVTIRNSDGSIEAAALGADGYFSGSPGAIEFLRLVRGNEVIRVPDDYKTVFMRETP